MLGQFDFIRTKLFLRSGLTGLRNFVLIILMAGLVSACQSAEEKVASFTENGEAYLAAEDYVRASLEFRNALQINPEFTRALAGLAETELQRGNEAASATFYGRAVLLEPENMAYRLKAMRIMLTLGQMDILDELSAEGLKRAPDNAEVLALRAAFYLRLSQTASAIELANRSLEAAPDNQDALLVLSAERVRAGRPEEAIAYLDRGLAATTGTENVDMRLLKVEILEKAARFEDAEAEYRQLIEFSPEMSRYRRGLGLLLLRAERFEEAEQIFRFLAEQDPDAIQPKIDIVRMLNTAYGVERAEAELESMISQGGTVDELRFALAGLREREGRADEAIRTLNEIAELSGPGRSRVRALGRMGRLTLAGGDIEGAKRLIDLLLSEEERNQDALLMRAELAVRERRLEDAIADLRTIQVDEPYSVEAALALARVYELRGALNLAETQYGQAFRFSSGGVQAGLAYVQFLTGRQAFDRAEEVLVAVLSRTPNSLSVLRALAQVRIQQQDWVGAREVASVLERYGEDQYVVSQIEALATTATGGADAGLEIMQRAFEEAPEQSRPLTGLIQAYLRSGRQDEAVAFLMNLIEKEEENLQPKVMLAEIKAARGELGEAENLFTDVLTAAGNQFYPYRAAYAFYARQFRFKEARSVLEAGRAKGVDSGNMDLLLGEILQFEGNFEGAISLYGKMLETYPNLEVAANNLASLLTDHKEDTESFKRARQLSERFRDSQVPQFKDTLGWSMYKLGEYEAAVSVLSDVAKQAPGSAVVLYHLGVSEAALGERGKAEETLIRARNLVAGQTGALVDAISTALAGLDADTAPAAGTESKSTTN